ncbi:MAG: YlmC/YmxH family sporulation protein [Lachnospiraceae bacterium]|jgi:YlmC/YmxH family sporulation protein|nr:YlmC/YmxH family sporulation protein [Lachnospiraceae bacterium]
MRYSELRKKEVINVATGKSLGFVCDLTFDERTGCICALVVPEQERWCGFFLKENTYCIEFNRIVRVGPDFILINECELHKDNK